MLEHWDLIIADFRREYQIDLYRNTRVIGEDEFFILLGGLSGESRFVYALSEKVKPATNTSTNTNTVRQKIVTEVSNPRELRSALGR